MEATRFSRLRRRILIAGHANVGLFQHRAAGRARGAPEPAPQITASPPVNFPPNQPKSPTSSPPFIKPTTSNRSLWLIQPPKGSEVEQTDRPRAWSCGACPKYPRQGREGAAESPEHPQGSAPKAAPPFTPDDSAAATLPSGRGPCSIVTMCRSSALWWWHSSERVLRNAADPAQHRATGRRHRAELLGFPAERRYLLALPKPSRTDCFRIIQ